MSGAQLDVLDAQVPVVRQLEPRRDAAVVVERGDEDLVARLRSRGPTVRESMKFSEVMFGPKITSWGSQPRNAAAFASASVTIAPTRRLVS